jgi:RNA polymerase sigma-70 factor (ECF subfamily)
MTDRSDEDLVREFVATESRGAFGELYTRYRDKIFNTAYRIVNDYDGARDVAHDVFLKVYVEARGFRFRSSFSSWIYRITVNRSLDEARRAKRRRGHFSTDEINVDLPSRRSDDLPYEVALNHEAEEALMTALEALSGKLRTVITLRYFEALSYDQIAEIIGRPVGTVKSRLRRAHRRLGKLLVARGFDQKSETGDGLQSGK